MATLEKQIETKCKVIAERHGCMLRKVVSPGFTGWPDRQLLMRPGKIIFMEFKRPGKKPTLRQAFVMEQIRAFGFDVYKVDNVEDFKDILHANL